MSSIKKFYSRSELGMARPRRVSNSISPQHGGAAVHYGGAAQSIGSEERARQVWLGWQRYHMNHHGWVDIAYTAGFDNWGNVYAGRGFGVRTAANGTNAGNQNFYAFCWLGGGNEEPSAEALEALNWLIDEARRDGGAGLAVRSHSDFKSTGCPGDYLRDRAAELNGQRSLPDPDGAPAPAPTPQPDSGSGRGRVPVVTVGDRGSNVRSWQRDLLKWRPGILPRFGADGDFGQETRAATITFMRASGLISSGSSPAQPQVGPKTRDAMAKALEGGRRNFRFRYTAILRQGSNGPAVDEWQRAVRAWNPSLIPGYTSQSGGPGSFGPQTVTATRRYQQAARITVDGVVGPQTRNAMTRTLNS